MTIITLNCRGIACETRLYELEETLKGQNYDILGISETRKVGEKLIKKMGTTFFIMGPQKGSEERVSIYIKSGRKSLRK